MDEVIKTFLCVKERGSFSKAAEALYLTANGVKKRMNRLEEDTGLTLFARSSKGVTLTAAGEMFYEECRRIEGQLALAVQRARKVQEENTGVLRIGLMTTFSDSFTVTSWRGIRREDAVNQSSMVYYGSSLKDMERMFTEVGTCSDCCVDLYDEAVARRYGLQTKRISQYALRVGLPKGASGERMTPESLAEMPVALLSKGRGRVFDMLWEALEGRTRVVEIKDYSIKTFNECYLKDTAVICTENLTNVFPFYRFVPLEFDQMVAYGIYYKESKSLEMDALAEILREGKPRDKKERLTEM